MEKVEDVVAGGCRRLHLGHALGQGAQGRGEQPHIEDERNNDAEGDLSAHGQGGTQDADRHIAQVADDSHQGLHDAGEELAAPLCVVQNGIHPAEGLFYLLVGPGEAHHVVAGVHLLNIAVQGAQVLLPGTGASPQP